MGISIKINSKPKSVFEQLSLTWNYKHLIIMFFLRDIKIKYSQTKFKVAWILLQPLLMMLVFTFFFGFILKWQTDGIPYPIYVFSGLIIWNLFQGIIQTSVSLYFENSALIKHNNFPKITMVVAKVLNAIIDALLSFLILIILMILFSMLPSWKIIFLFVPIFLTAALSISIVLFVISISYKKKDFIYALPYLLSFLIWITPIFFSTNILPQNIKFLIYFNPIAGLVDLWRGCLFAKASFNFNYCPILLFNIPLLAISFAFYCGKETYINDNL